MLEAVKWYYDLDDDVEAREQMNSEKNGNLNRILSLYMRRLQMYK